MMQIVLDRLDDVVLARTAIAGTAASEVEIARALRSLAPPSLDDAQWSAAIRASLDRLRAAPPAAETAAEHLGLRALPAWRPLVDRILPGLALGVAADDARAHKRLADRDQVAAAIVARAHGLWHDGAPPSASAVCDALVWRALGLAGKAKRTPPEIRAHFLAQLVDSSAGTPDRLLRLLAIREVAAVRADLRALREALGRRWLCGVAWRDDDAAPTLEAFAATVRDAAARATTGLFGDRKVFIASAWHALRDQPNVGAISLDEFKQKLLAAHRAGLLSLARADLAGAMDPDAVASSETRHLEARYHFIERESAP